MIPAITWAILATGGAVAVYLLMRAENRKLDRMGYGQYVRAEKLAGELADEKQLALEVAAAYEKTIFNGRQALHDERAERRRQASEALYFLERATVAELKLADIRAQRYFSAVKARQAQLSQQRAKVLAKASELTPVPVDTRKAA